LDNEFHIPITSEEFRYALTTYSCAVSGKLHVPEIAAAAADPDTKMVGISVSAGNTTIRISYDKKNRSAAGLFAVAKEFIYSGEKAVSILLHILIYEKIITDPRLYPLTQSQLFFKGPFLDIIKDIPVKIGEEEHLNDLNMDYIMEKFRAVNLS